MINEKATNAIPPNLLEMIEAATAATRSIASAWAQVANTLRRATWSETRPLATDQMFSAIEQYQIELIRLDDAVTDIRQDLLARRLTGPIAILSPDSEIERRTIE